MPQMANIVVKDASNADVTFVVLTPSAGDTTQAQWRASALGATPALAPALSSKTQYNGPRTARSVSLNAIFPVTQTSDGVTSVIARQPFALTTTVPLNMTRAAALQHATLFANVVKNALIQDILTDGYNAS